MPYRKPYRKRTRRTRKTKRFKTIRNIVPDSHVVKLKYVEQFNLNAGTGTNAVHVFRANSIFDPSLTTTGHQPLGRDQWLPFYDHYLVIGAKIKCQFISVDADGNTGSQMVGIMLQDSSTSNLNPINIMEQTGSTYKVLTSSDAMQKAVVSKGFSPKKFFGLKDISDNRSLVGAAQDGNPTEGAYWLVYQAPLDPTQNCGTIRCIATIEYLVKYTERKTLAQS